MSLFKKKCEYCREKIEEGKGISKDVKIPGLIGTRKKSFCCSEHANKYEEETNKKKSGGGGGCCG